MSLKITKLTSYFLPTGKRQALSEVVDKLSSCENCRKLESKSSKKKKTFCSPACAKLSNKSTDDQTTIQSADQSSSNEPSTNGNLQQQVVNPSRIDDTATTSDGNTSEVPDDEPVDKWTVSKVCNFIRDLKGCSDYAEDFENQEIDGQALLLLKEDNLVNVMQMKLGPALKIVASVRQLIVPTQEQ